MQLKEWYRREIKKEMKKADGQRVWEITSLWGGTGISRQHFLQRIAKDMESEDDDLLLHTGQIKLKGGKFPEGSWQLLEEIIVNGEGGRFLEILSDRSPNANMARAAVWRSITKQFNKVIGKGLPS